MALKAKLWSLMLKLPDVVKLPILRRIVSFPGEIPTTLRFKVAETEDELTQAFSLLHDAYVKEQLMDPHPSGMRVTKYHILPSTTTLIAIENGVVVGTVSLIRQSSFGLPLKAIFDLDFIPPQSRPAEVSALAIKKEYLHQRGRILFPLLKFLYHYSRDYFGVSHFVIAVNPKWIDFYKSMLCFKPLAKKMVESYDFVNGAPAVGGILNLETAPELFFSVFGKRKTGNIYKFFCDLPQINMEFPLRKRSIISDPMLTPSMIDHFFIKKTNCLQRMNENELSILHEMYEHPQYSHLFPTPKVVSMRKRRAGKRLETSLRARLQVDTHRSHQVVIQDINVNGFGGYANAGVITEIKDQKILVNIEELTPCEVVGSFVRIQSNGHFGFVITQPNARWIHFVKNLELRMQPMATEESVAKILQHASNESYSRN